MKTQIAEKTQREVGRSSTAPYSVRVARSVESENKIPDVIDLREISSDAVVKETVRRSSKTEMRLPIFILLEVALVLAIPFLAIEGYYTLLDSKAGTFAQESTSQDPGWSELVEATPIYAAIEVRDKKVQGVHLLIENGGDDTALYVPGETIINEKKLSSYGEAQAASVLAKKLNIAVREIKTFEDDKIRKTIAANEPIALAAFDVRNASGAQLGTSSWIEQTLPLINGTQEIDTVAAEQLVRSIVAFPAGYEPGMRLPLRIVARTSEVPLNDVVLALAAEGFEVSEVANLPIFDEGDSAIIVPRSLLGEDAKTSAEEVDRLVSVFGTDMVIDETAEEGSPVTVLIGANYEFHSADLVREQF